MKILFFGAKVLLFLHIRKKKTKKVQKCAIFLHFCTFSYTLPRLLSSLFCTAGSLSLAVMLAAFVTAAALVMTTASVFNRVSLAALNYGAVSAASLFRFVTFVAIFAAAHSHTSNSCQEKKFLHNCT